MQVLYDTKLIWQEKQALKRQEVHIPTCLLGVQRGSYTRQFKSMVVHGTVRVREDWGTEKLALYGTCRHQGQEIMCVATGEHGPWQGIDARPVQEKERTA
jgi:hypothetical protein